MISLLLKAKHWQMFLLLVGLPCLTSLIAHLNTGGPMFGPDSILAILPLWGYIYFQWMVSLSMGLRRYIPAELRCKTSLFLFCLFYPIFYFAVLYFILRPLVDTEPWVVTTIIPLHLFAMFCIFYCLYFSAKTIKMAELQRKVTFGDFAGEFFLLWYFPIGVWLIQPKVNKIAG